MCVCTVTSVCVFYDSECIPFELHGTSVCALTFFLNVSFHVCSVKFCCTCGLFFRGNTTHIVFTRV